MPSDSEFLAKALVYAEGKHLGQVRKMEAGRTGVPYYAHIHRVGVKLMAIWNTGVPVNAEFNDFREIVAAGYLHDTLEDTKTTFDELVNEFGLRTATLVKEVTHVPVKCSWHEKNQRYIVQMKQASLGAVLISLCDKLDNMNSIISNFNAGVDGFKVMNSTPKKQIAKYHDLSKIYVARLQDVLPTLVREYIDTVTKLTAFAEKPRPL